MAITEEELKELIEPKADIEKLSTVSSDGSSLLTRIPQDVVGELKIKKKDKLRWLVGKKKKEITLLLEKENGSEKKKKNN